MAIRTAEIGHMITWSGQASPTHCEEEQRQQKGASNSFGVHRDILLPVDDGARPLGNCA